MHHPDLLVPHDRVIVVFFSRFTATFWQQRNVRRFGLAPWLTGCYGTSMTIACHLCCTPYLPHSCFTSVMKSSHSAADFARRCSWDASSMRSTPTCSQQHHSGVCLPSSITESQLLSSLPRMFSGPSGVSRQKCLVHKLLLPAADTPIRASERQSVLGVELPQEQQG